MTLLVLHVAACWFLTGLVWFVQVVHYPLMHRVAGGGFARYEAEHTRRTAPVVAPVMFFELGTGLWLALAPPAAFDPVWMWVNLAGLAVIWASTFLLQVPAHRLLDAGYRADAVERLVRTNWLRTAAWSARALVFLVLLLAAVREPAAGVPQPAPTTTPSPSSDGS